VCGFKMEHLVMMMAVLLALGTVYTVLGGMLSVLVTDFLQFIVMSAGLIAVTILILVKVDWEKLIATVTATHGAGGFNPLAADDLGWPYLIFYTMLNLACVLTWQTTISRLLAAKDAKTGQQVYTRTAFFFTCRFLIPVIWGIAALAVLTPGDLKALDPALGMKPSLHAMPLFLSQVVPVGLMGLLVAAMLAADMSSTSSYMITWASVIYNDILAPFRKTRWSERRGLLWNRTIVTLIGFFLLFYGLLYPLKGNVWDYLAITGTIYLASMSTLLIACCYWRRANNWGAAGAILVGAVIPLSYLVMQQLPATAVLAKNIGEYYCGIAAFSAAALAMVVGSLLKPAAVEEPSEARVAQGAAAEPLVVLGTSGGEP